jgi:hypothetical protein
MYYEVLEQLTRDRTRALVREAEAARLVSQSRANRRRSRRRVSAVVLELLHSRRTSARAESQA